MSTATLADLCRRGDSAKSAVILPDCGSRTSYRQLLDQIEALAARLRQTGLQPGDVVTIVLPNGLENLACFLAVTRARLVAAPLNQAYKAEEFRFYLEDAGAKAVIAMAETHAIHDVAADMSLPLWKADRDAHGAVRLQGEKLKASAGGVPEPPQAGDVALFLHTSGTTSRPKGVPLTHGNLMTSIQNIANHYQLSAADTSLVVMPLFHVHGLIGATLSS